MNNSNEFHTLKGYQNNAKGALTPTMEDYLEMITRLLNNQAVVRVSELSHMLNVKPSSATKIVQSLKEQDYIDYEKYGYISLTPKGQNEGNYLLYRHNVLHNFLCCLNHTDNELEQVEKIEHFLNRPTIEHIKELTEKLQSKQN